MYSVYDFRVMRILRRRLKLTLKELARCSGLTYPTVESVETNKTLPSLKTLDAIAGALQISAGGSVKRQLGDGGERMRDGGRCGKGGRRWDAGGHGPALRFRGGKGVGGASPAVAVC